MQDDARSRNLEVYQLSKGSASLRAKIPYITSDGRLQDKLPFLHSGDSVNPASAYETLATRLLRPVSSKTRHAFPSPQPNLSISASLLFLSCNFSLNPRPSQMLRHFLKSCKEEARKWQRVDSSEVTGELGSSFYGLAMGRNHDLVPPLFFIYFFFWTRKIKNKMGFRVVYKDGLLSILRVQGIAST